MVTIYKENQIEKIGKAGRILAACHQEIAKMIRPGITTMEIDQFVEQFLQQYGATPEQKGYKGYQYATCASVNHEVCHGFPRKEAIHNGDIVTIDMVVNLDGYLADSAWSYPVGKVSKDVKRLLHVTKEALYIGIQQATVGNRIGDIGHAIQTFVESKGYSVVREFTGHGVGKSIHEDPYVPHFGRPGTGMKLKEGMVITIEPMVNMGEHFLYLDANGWTAKTVDGKWSAQYEHTISITKDGPLILTEQDEDDKE
ncbi:type I methionyl aminopeptidase [Tepidibacillus marianensis]|uniref:type I methionyl aminopeptidase n=1 Tax=Tepidibacillus marianensis TaxID=3131995 RepID=UPI0030CF0EB6